MDAFREPMGVVILEGCTVELAEEETDFHAFKVQNDKIIQFRLMKMYLNIKGYFPWRWKDVWKDLYLWYGQYGGFRGLDEADCMCELRLHEVDGRRAAAATVRT